MLTKTTQIPKLIFDTEKLKIGQKVKYLENWTRYDTNIQNESNSISGINEIECTIRDISENSLTLIELKEYIGFLGGRDIVYHNIYKINANDSYKIELI